MGTPVTQAAWEAQQARDRLASDVLLVVGTALVLVAGLVLACLWGAWLR